MSLFVACSIGKVSITEVAKPLFPYLGVMTLVCCWLPMCRCSRCVCLCSFLDERLFNYNPHNIISTGNWLALPGRLVR